MYIDISDNKYLFLTTAHGATVGFQPVYSKRNWLGCPDATCYKKSCPNLIMEGSDWTKCWGEVFRIYRKKGPGVVLAGDLVGIYYPREKKWLSLSGGLGQKQTCPGNPSSAYGFSSYVKWAQCYGEVFGIFARGRTLGTAITEGDYITLYYVHDKKWVGLVEDYVDLRTCPGEEAPPADDRYDVCWGEIFQLWRK